MGVSSGAAALVLINERLKIDAVLTDVVMPGMNGLALATMLRRIRSDLPIIFMTGHADRQELVGELVLDKPFTAQSLEAGVRASLTRPVG